MRIAWVDTLRGLAIILMVVFHFCYDLRFFGFVDWSVPNGDYWWLFRYVILSVFILMAGISLTLAYAGGFRFTHFGRRFLVLLAASLAVSTGSVFLFPDAWIYFGILHFIALGSLLGVGLVGFPGFSWVLGLAIIVAYNLGVVSKQWPFVLFESWLPQDTEDFVPLFPWLGVLFLGVAIPRWVPLARLSMPSHTLLSTMAFMGRHSLVIYLLHQPLLFAGFYLVKWVF